MSKRDPGPFLHDEYIPDKRIDRGALELLTSTGLLPEEPKPVAVDKICDNKWGVPEDYKKLDVDVMGYSAFTYNGFARIVINSELENDRSVTGTQRLRSTIAHEIGHAILHERLFIEKLMFDKNQRLLFGEIERHAPVTAIVCRNNDIFGRSGKSKWWEIQANKFMAALLMPKPLFLQIVQSPLADYDPEHTTPPERVKKYYGSIEAVMEKFNVSRVMASIAVDHYLAKERPKAAMDALL